MPRIALLAPSKMFQLELLVVSFMMWKLEDPGKAQVRLPCWVTPEPSAGQVLSFPHPYITESPSEACPSRLQLYLQVVMLPTLPTQQWSTCLSRDA